jgi:hypothetical protein
MHDSEPDTIILKTFPQRLGEILSEFGIESNPIDIGTDDVEKGDYYSRCFSQTPRMVTNKGCLELKKSNIDVVQIIQKG